MGAFAKLVEDAGELTLPPDISLWAGVAAWENGDPIKARELWSGGVSGPDYGKTSLHTRSCQRLLGRIDRAGLLAGARLLGYRYLGDALFVEGLALERAGEKAAAKAAFQEARAACRQQEFPARLIDRALARLD